MSTGNDYTGKICQSIGNWNSSYKLSMLRHVLNIRSLSTSTVGETTVRKQTIIKRFQTLRVKTMEQNDNQYEALT